METDLLDDGVRSQITETHKVIPYTTRFVEPRLFLEDSKTLTAGSSYKFNLQALVGKVSHIIVGIRAAGGNTNNALFTYTDLGRGAMLDITDTGGQTQLGMGTRLDATWLRNELWNHHFSNELSQVKPLYLLPFTNNVTAAAQGKMDGYMDYPAGANYSLEIIPGAALVAEVHRVTHTAALTGGNFRLKYKNSLTDPLPYNTSSANLAAAVNALRDVRRDGISVAASAAFSAGATVDFTWSAGFNYDGTDSLIQMVDPNTISAGPVYESGVTTRQTAGNGGFTTGVYTIVVGAWLFKEYTTVGNFEGSNLIV